MPSKQKYTDDEILSMLQSCKDEHGKCSPDLFREHDEFCSVSLVMRRFGSWSEAKAAAGIDEDLSGETGRNRKYSDEQILSHLRELQRRHGKVTTDRLNQEDDLVAASVVATRFDSWSDAKEKAGLTRDERSKNSRPRQYSDEDYLKMIRECKDRHGKATQRVFNDDDSFPTAGAVRKRFGDWSTAKELADVDSIAGETRGYTESELLSQLRQCNERYGKCTARVFASDDEFASPETVQRKFGKWDRAKTLAGIDD